MNIRVGFGYDMHRFQEGRELWIGGMKIDYSKGLQGYSDADVLIHAICDALLGAANLRDIGYNFPNTEDEFKDIDSKILLKRTEELLQQKGFSIGNIDATVCTEKPKLNPYIQEIQKRLSTILKIDEENVSVKATTSEKMGFVGREEGITAYAVALIEKQTSK
ncbi:MAG: 2-C-methyl-D-erythritol 2,4-cyclodiphosphate synthase [Dysgonamonadaceae bacterium]|jgi:2-C-methyl-D-erythritol 2,4-cyclodiphosphate synthase|nr:2-C-methyl-D-erythritol 2,4-cyclodiphosphate synthase [Dysgonamonadaceae bacterium]MDD3356769.1 2-C-methyl-D-erythritol 2,4-cyclodiphosphate synthase [Dysgonamonadaceae bacterium]MDD4246487.1 2-C-methyl-D-erythritol 2,4-cyclodiphosphate synthase [Dysgonamonadaceae bacterium]MDD4606188.1 2-C-methyl-D-erythritol 2,4-cyclodiphosphate synthase [Dysgonamonadaceae bacterium]HUI32079.1 2-C-methyl-D-erythritol 2,4-cyclodiphosphate synthase [Dysgonamonadaceae bacterium]